MKNSSIDLIRIFLHFSIMVLIIPISLHAIAPPSHAQTKDQRWETKEIILKESNPEYEIKCHFPAFKKTAAFDPTSLNEKIEGLVKERVIESKNNFKTRDSASNAGPKSGSYLDLGYQVFEPTPKLVSVVFHIESYSTGAAHPVHWSESLSYDKSRSRYLKLGSILNSGADYLACLSKLSIEDLSKQNGLDDINWIKEGAGPRAKNFDSFYLDKKGLGIIFDEYKVGPYVAGAHQVLIPYSKLKELIDPSLNLE